MLGAVELDPLDGVRKCMDGVKKMLDITVHRKASENHDRKNLFVYLTRKQSCSMRYVEVVVVHRTSQREQTKIQLTSLMILR